MQIDQTNISDAVDLLVDGFPASSRNFWEKGIARIQASHLHRAAGESAGKLLYVDDKPVGVALTAVSHRAGATSGERQRVVNLSSWYIKPDHRWQLPFMLSKMLRDRKSVYTDLTPIPAVWPFLESLGFEPLNHGVNAVCIPAASLYHLTSHRVLDWDQAYTSEFPESIVDSFEEHLTLGCQPYVIATADKMVPVLIKPCKIKGIPSAEVIYCDDNQELARAIGGLCRKLARQRLLTLLVDIPTGEQSQLSPVAVPMTRRRRRFIKNGEQANRTDYTYSELVFFDF